MHESTIIQRALLSVYDKSNIIELAECLHLFGVEILSTGNTATLLKEHGLPVTQVSEYTGFPEMMQGRVKTLHPKIHGGILGRRDVDSEIMIAHDIPDIDLVVVNLYPFESVTQKPNCTLNEAIENIDIGGPTLIRAAAKNHEWCSVLVCPSDYADFIKTLQANHGAIKHDMRFQLAAKAFTHTARYDSHVANYLGKKVEKLSIDDFGNNLSLHYSLKERLRYGENPHQQAAFYLDTSPNEDSIAKAIQHQGKELSYNNIVDADTALECVKHFKQPSCVIVKHANPCGVAVASSVKEAYQKAYACDPTSAFGGILAFNHLIDENILQYILDSQFVEVLIAPAFSDEALAIGREKPNCRLLQFHPSSNITKNRFDLKSVNGGLLVQTSDPDDFNQDYQIVSKIEPTPEQMQDLIFSWHVAKYVKSNAIVYAKKGQTLGIGAGQMSRIVSTEIAGSQALKQNFNLQGAVMASDAFFPFQDNVEKAHEYGIKAIISPGGSKRDNEVIACANDLGLAMVFTGIRHFRH